MLQGIPQSAIPSSNIGKVNNRGFEVELNYVQPVTKDLTMQFRGTFNYNKNKVTYIDEPINPSDYVYRYRQTGFPMNTNWGYKIDYSNGNGFFNTQEELDEYLSQTTYSFGTPGLGDFKYMEPERRSEWWTKRTRFPSATRRFRASPTDSRSDSTTRVSTSRSSSKESRNTPISRALLRTCTNGPRRAPTITITSGHGPRSATKTARKSPIPRCTRAIT